MKSSLFQICGANQIMLPAYGMLLCSFEAQKECFMCLFDLK